MTTKLLLLEVSWGWVLKAKESKNYSKLLEVWSVELKTESAGGLYNE